MTQGKRKPTKAAPRKNTQARSAGRETQSRRSASSSSQRSTQARPTASAESAAKRPTRSANGATAKKIYRAKDVAVRAMTDTASDVGSGARRAARATASFLSANAVPLTLLGLGTGFLAMAVLQRRRHNEAVLNASLRGEPMPPERDARELLAQGRDKLTQLAHRAAQGAQQAGERVQEAAVRIGDRAVELGHDAVDGLVSAEERARQFAKEHPVATTAAGVAAGVGIAMALPDSQLEKRVLEPVREKLADSAEAVFNEVKSGVQTAFEAAKDVKNDLVGGARR
jgi:hypothetical protein